MTSNADDDGLVGLAFTEPLQCSQGGVPYNGVHLKAQASKIRQLRADLAAAESKLASMEAELTRVRADERERCAQIAERHFPSQFERQINVVIAAAIRNQDAER